MWPFCEHCFITAGWHLLTSGHRTWTWKGPTCLCCCDPLYVVTVTCTCKQHSTNNSRAAPAVCLALCKLSITTWGWVMATLKQWTHRCLLLRVRHGHRPSASGGCGHANTAWWILYTKHSEQSTVGQGIILNVFWIRGIRKVQKYKKLSTIQAQLPDEKCSYSWQTCSFLEHPVPILMGPDLFDQPTYPDGCCSKRLMCEWRFK